MAVSDSRIVQVTITETVTRVAHLRLNSDSQIDQACLESTEVASLLEQAGQVFSCEKDAGTQVEVELIEPDQQYRYQRSIDSHLDISCLDPAAPSQRRSR